jgi:hypothetical protein
MKKTLILAIAALFVASGVSAAVLVSDTFSYPDGSLVGNGGWASHSGTLGDLLVAGGEVVVQHGAPSEDANVEFAPTGGGNVYYGIDFMVANLGAPYSGSDNEYFAHFKVIAANASPARRAVFWACGGGDFSVGIASDESTADATWPADLSYDVVYRAVVRYDQDANIAELWIDPSSSADPSILGEDRADPGDAVDSFALRQSDSTPNETVIVDNLIVSDTFEDACCPGVPTESRTWGEVKGLYR